MIYGKHFTPTSADVVDGIAISRRSAAHELVEARQEQLLQLSKQLVDAVLGFK